MISCQSARWRTVSFLALAIPPECALYAQRVLHTSRWSTVHCEAVLMGRLCWNVPMLVVTMTVGCLVVDCVDSASLVAIHATTICHSLHSSASGSSNSLCMVRTTLVDTDINRMCGPVANTLCDPVCNCNIVFICWHLLTECLTG